MKCFAVRDLKAEGFNTPFFSQTFGLAERDFKSAMSDSAHPMSKHKEDFALYYLGEFSQESGCLIPEPQPKHICNAQ